MEPWDLKVELERARRLNSLQKVTPQLQGVPSPLPLNSQSLPRVVLTQHEIEITEGYTVTKLLVALRERKLSVEEVTRAFLRRAALAQIAVR